jgi:hypothetical protein
VIGSVRQILDTGTHLQELLRAMSRPDVRIVSLTVTEKGYCHDPATGLLQEDRPAVNADLARPQAPGTAPGILVEAHVIEALLDRVSGHKAGVVGVYIRAQYRQEKRQALHNCSSRRRGLLLGMAAACQVSF